MQAEALEQRIIFSREYFSNSAKDSILRLKRIVLPELVETQLAQFYKKTGGIKPLLFDFSKAAFIDITALAVCISTLVQRKESSLQTFLAFPESKRVRDFLKVWRFPEAVQGATKLPFEIFLLEEDHRYLVENQETFAGRGTALDALEFDADWKSEMITRRNFFEFTTFALETGDAIVADGPFASVPRKESRRWTGPLIEQVLSKHLGSNSPRDDVGRVVIYEAVSNAVRHPHAKVIQVVSKFNRKIKYKETISITDESKQDNYISKRLEGSLGISIWDDGESIANTLQELVQQGKPIQHFKLPSYMCEKIHVLIKTFDEEKKRVLVVKQSECPTKEATEPRILLSSLFPGISRTVSESVPKPEPYVEGEEPFEEEWLFHASPGMGLYSLVRTALDQYQGTLRIRSGHCRLWMAVAHDAYRIEHNVRYKCRITLYPESYPPFRGNLITIQLPIRDSA